LRSKSPIFVALFLRPTFFPAPVLSGGGCKPTLAPGPALDPRSPSVLSLPNLRNMMTAWCPSSLFDPFTLVLYRRIMPPLRCIRSRLSFSLAATDSPLSRCVMRRQWVFLSSATPFHVFVVIDLARVPLLFPRAFSIPFAPHDIFVIYTPDRCIRCVTFSA